MGVEEEDSDLDTDAERYARLARWAYKGPERFAQTDLHPHRDPRGEGKRNYRPAEERSRRPGYAATNQISEGIGGRVVRDGRTLEDEAVTASKNVSLLHEPSFCVSYSSRVQVDMLRDMHEIVKATEEKGKSAPPVEE